MSCAHSLAQTMGKPTQLPAWNVTNASPDLKKIGPFVQLLQMAVLLLADTLEPLNVISDRRLVLLLSKDKVAFLSSADEEEGRLAVAQRRLPDQVLIVRLLRHVRPIRRSLHPNRRNLLLRDQHTCQYCGCTALPRELTIDHVVPLSAGGSSTWENLVVACKRCNGKKASQLVEQAGMKLLRKPREPRTDQGSILFLRYPELRVAFDAFCRVA